MKPKTKILILAFVMAIAGLAEAGSWSGRLVDSKCYEDYIGNANPKEANTTANRNMSWIIRRCAPNAKTKSFGLVHQNWQMSELDSTGNAKAVELVHKVGKESVYSVTVSGEMEGNTLKVDSMSTQK